LNTGRCGLPFGGLAERDSLAGVTEVGEFGNHVEPFDLPHFTEPGLPNKQARPPPRPLPPLAPWPPKAALASVLAALRPLRDRGSHEA